MQDRCKLLVLDPTGIFPCFSLRVLLCSALPFLGHVHRIRTPQCGFNLPLQSQLPCSWQLAPLLKSCACRCCACSAQQCYVRFACRINRPGGASWGYGSGMARCHALPGASPIEIWIPKLRPARVSSRPTLNPRTVAVQCI